MTNTSSSPHQSDLATERVLVLDFGSQFAQLIARRVREQHVYAEIVRHNITADRIRELAPTALILSGGPSSVYAEAAPQCDAEIFDLGFPILGICYGMQLMCQALGGRVESHPVREYGRSHCCVTAAMESDDLFAGVPRETEVWMSQGDQVQMISDQFYPLARPETFLL